MVELKPCPFCGGKPYLETSHRAFIKAKTTKVAYVRCKSCEARSGRFELSAFGRSSVSIEANKKAIEAWNRRAEDGKIDQPAKTGYCSLCDKHFEVRSNESHGHCPDCGHHVALHDEEVYDGRS